MFRAANSPGYGTFDTNTSSGKTPLCPVTSWYQSEPASFFVSLKTGLGKLTNTLLASYETLDSQQMQEIEKEIDKWNDASRCTADIASPTCPPAHNEIHSQVVS